MTKSKIILIFIIPGLIVYFNSLFNSFVWDDEEQVVNNNVVHSLANLPSFFTGSTFNTGGRGGLAGMYYKPMMSTSFAILYTFFGPNPFFFHLFQLTIHLINTILVFYLFKNYFHQKLAFCLSIIFLVHPLNNETVVYVSALQDALCFCFGLLALLLAQKKTVNFGVIFIVAILFLLSFLSKETGFLFIPILFLTLLLYQQKKLPVYLISIFCTILVYLIMRFGIAKIALGSSGPSPIMQISFWERLINIPQIIFYYLKTFFWPQNLAIAQHWLIKSINFSQFYLPLIIILLILAGFISLGWKLKKDHLKFKCFILFFSWLTIGLSLHLQIFPLDMTVADRWFYFPMVGILGLLGLIFDYLYQQKKLPVITGFIFLIIIITLSVRTMVRNTNWKDGLTLYQHDVLISQDAFDLENNLGVELFRAGKTDEAAWHFEKSVKLAPHWWTNWNNLGVIFERQDNYQKARDYYQKAIDNGQYYLAYENLANLLLKYDSPENTKIFITNSLQILPVNGKLWFILALTEYKLGNHQAALEAAQKAYILYPSEQSSYLYSRLQNNLPLE